MSKTRHQIIKELERRKQAENNATRKTCVTSWLNSVQMWLDYTARDFENALADAERANRITPSKAAGPQAEQARQDTLTLIAELKNFLAEDGEEEDEDEDDAITGRTDDSDLSHYDSAVSELDQ